jgi:hypothetical protein
MIDQSSRLPASWPTAEQMALDGIRADWESLYDVGYADSAYHAFRWPDGPLITATTLPGLDSAIRADFVREAAW